MKSAVLVALLFLTAASAQAAQSGAFLIVPGKSVGKITLRDTRNKVHEKMGRPQVTFTETATSYKEDPSAGTPEGLARSGGYLTVKEQKITADVYLRPRSEGSLKILYASNVVIQIQVSLRGYKTRSGLSIDSRFTVLEKLYKTPEAISWVIYPDDRSPFVEEMWDYVPQGLALFSRGFYAGGPPENIRTIIVHERNRHVLNGSRTHDGELVVGA